MIDYHVHTPLCNHAEGEMEAYILKAIDIGLKEICFLDHLTICEAGKNLSMDPEQVPFYFETARQFQEQYKDLIGVRIGLEVDFNPENMGLVAEIIAAHPFDVVGTSLHFFGDVDVVRYKSTWNRGEGDTDRIYNLYYSQIEKMLTYDCFDMICHFDLIKKFKRLPSISFDGRIDDILSEMKTRQLALELNTSGYTHKIEETYPSREIIEMCVGKGIHITLGSDAHRPEEVGRHFDRALQLLLAAGCMHLTVFNKRRPAKIQITEG
jgi:histidinol-phosphatase (PHP family)